MRSAVKLVSLLWKHACVIANQMVVAPLTELISCAALKRKRNRLAAEHGRVMLVAQRSQIACHGLYATNVRRALSLPERNEYRLSGSFPWSAPLLLLRHGLELVEELPLRQGASDALGHCDVADFTGSDAGTIPDL